jgi:two-component system cell cycle sensor histidine kinase/response regulator CckA
MAGVDLGIDQLMIKEMSTVSSNNLYPGRMAFITATNFMLIATSFLMLLRTPKPIWVIQTCSWLIVLISIISVFNYLYGANPNSVYAKYTTLMKRYP